MPVKMEYIFKTGNTCPTPMGNYMVSSQQTHNKIAL